MPHYSPCSNTMPGFAAKILNPRTDIDLACDVTASVNYRVPSQKRALLVPKLVVRYENHHLWELAHTELSWEAICIKRMSILIDAAPGTEMETSRFTRFVFTLMSIKPLGCTSTPQSISIGSICTTYSKGIRGKVILSKPQLFLPWGILPM